MDLFGVFYCFGETSARPISWIFKVQKHILRFFVLNICFVLLFFSSFLNLFVSFCYIRQLSVIGLIRMPCKLCINSNTFGDWFWSSYYSCICLTNHFWCCCVYQLSGLWKWQPVCWTCFSSFHSGYPCSWCKQRHWHMPCCHGQTDRNERSACLDRYSVHVQSIGI